MHYKQPPQSNPEAESSLQDVGLEDPRQSADQVIEGMLGTPLPEEQGLPRRRLASLLKEIQAIDGKERDSIPDEQYRRGKTTENEYIRYKARTVYSVVSHIPERNGLTHEDFFYIGCSVVLEDARSRSIPQPGDRRSTADTKIYPKIRSACNQAAVDMLRQGAWRGAIETSVEEANELIPYDEDTIPGDYMDPHTEAEKAETEAAIESALNQLSARDKRILELRYGLGSQHGESKTKVEVGKRFEVTRQSIQQIESRLLKKFANSREIDFSESGTDEQVRKRSPIIISSNPEERRQAKRLGYGVYGSGVISLLKELDKVSPHENPKQLIKDSGIMQRTLLLERLSGIRIPRDMSTLSQEDKRLLASNIVKVILERAGFRREQPLADES